MCELCETEPQQKAALREGYKYRAEQLHKLAHQLEGLAYGRIRPHSDEATVVKTSAVAVIRFLVEDWL